jgi:cellobiose-specific phosphotransferase system component IIB
MLTHTELVARAGLTTTLAATRMARRASEERSRRMVEAIGAPINALGTVKASL